MPETCENCGSTIGALETAYVLKNHVVCRACFSRLSTQADAPTTTLTASDGGACPNCGKVVANSASKCPSCGYNFGTRCPRCGKPARVTFKPFVILGAILLFPLGLLLLLLPRNGKCQSCGLRFDASGIKLA
jgi:hypothetical protein